MLILRTAIRLAAVAAATSFLLLGVATLRATPEFPQDPAQWVNGRPITLDSIKGKAVFLWYFETGCPTCRAKWPSILETTKKYEGKPVLFIGVSSGTTRKTVEEYVRETKVPWPIIVDTSRDFEKASNVGTISLQNIYQATYITAAGEMRQGNNTDIPGTVNTALQGAAWRVDPAGMPANLQPAWLAIEFGNFAQAAPYLKRATSGRGGNSDSKEFAAKLKAVVQKEVDQAVADAKAAEDKGNTWKALKTYQRVSQDYAGFDLPSDLPAKLKTLAADPQVKAGIKAQRDVETAKRGLNSPSAGIRKRAQATLERIVKDAPDSDAAAEARTLLQSDPASPSGPSGQLIFSTPPGSSAGK